MNYVYIIAVAFLMSIISLVTVLILDRKNKKQYAMKYYKMLSELYVNHSVIECLTIIREEFKKKSVEQVVIDKSIYYLQHSIMKDYDTAFTMIERILNSPEIKELHKSILEQEKVNVVLLLQ